MTLSAVSSVGEFALSYGAILANSSPSQASSSARFNAHSTQTSAPSPHTRYPHALLPDLFMPGLAVTPIASGYRPPENRCSTDTATASFQILHNRLGAQFSARYLSGCHSARQKHPSPYKRPINEVPPTRKLRWHDHSAGYFPSLPPKIDSPRRPAAPVNFHWVPQTGKPSASNAVKEATPTTQAARNQLIEKVLDLVSAQIRKRYKTDLTVSGLSGIVRPPPEDPAKNSLHIKFDHNPHNNTVDLKVDITQNRIRRTYVFSLPGHNKLLFRLLITAKRGLLRYQNKRYSMDLKLADMRHTHTYCDIIARKLTPPTTGAMLASDMNMFLADLHLDAETATLPPQAISFNRNPIGDAGAHSGIDRATPAPPVPPVPPPGIWRPF
jgi:hypothetical protein